MIVMFTIISNIPLGISGVFANETAEITNTLVTNGAIKIADFSNLTEETLMQNIGVVSEGNNLRVNTDPAYTLDSSVTSLRWDMPANSGTSSYFEIVSDYDLSQFEGMEYSIYVKFYGCRPEDNETYRFNKQIGAVDASGKVSYYDCLGMTLGATSDGANKWRSGYGLALKTNDFPITSKAIASRNPVSNSKIYIRLGANTGTGSAPIYIDGIWLVLTNYDKTNLANPVPSIENGAKVNVNEFLNSPVYSFEFGKDIMAESSAVVVRENGKDITSDVTTAIHGSRLDVTFNKLSGTTSTYTITVNKSKVRALTGETLSEDVEYSFNTTFETQDKIKKIKEIEEELFKTGIVKIADFSNLTEENLMKNIAKVEGSNSVETENVYTYEGATTSLKWTRESAKNGIVIKSDYDLSYFPTNTAVFIRFYSPKPQGEFEGFKISRGAGVSPEYVSSSYTDMVGFSFNSNNIGAWRNDLKIANVSDIINKSSSNPQADVYVYLKNESISGIDSTHPVYIDSIWLGLTEQDQRLSHTKPTSNGVWELKNPKASSTYAITFNKEIYGNTDGVSVFKDGVDITEECELCIEYYTLYIKFLNGLDSTSNYTIKVNKSTLKGVAGATLEGNFEDTFKAITAEVNSGYGAKTIVAEFGNGDISAAKKYSDGFDFELNNDSAFVSDGKTSSLKFTLPATDVDKAFYINPQISTEKWPSGSKLKFRFYNAGAPATGSNGLQTGDCAINIIAHKVGGEGNLKPYFMKEVTLTYGEWTEVEFGADVVLNAMSLNGSPMRFRINHGGWEIDSTKFVPNANIYLDSIWLEMPSYDNYWKEAVEPPADYAYSFAVIGDTQTMNYYYPMELGKIYDWVVDNADSNKIKYVFGLGDITEKDSDIEYALAKSHIKKLDYVVPYSIVRGNHDSKVNFERAFPYSEFSGNISGSYDSSMLNTYSKFNVGNIKYLVFALDYGPSDSVLSWAGDIIETHPEYNVIITTHAYLYRDGTTLDAGDVCPPASTGGFNNGDQMWDKLVKKYKNIVLVLSGHDPSDKVVVTQTKGEAGNVVTQMLIDPQGTDRNHGGAGLVAMLYFSEDGKCVDLRYYSTVKEAYFMESNQKSFNINVVENSDVEEETTITVDGVSFDVQLTGIGDSETVFVGLYTAEGRLSAIKQYPASPNIKVDFGPGETGKFVKIMVWKDKIEPLCEAHTIMLP